MNHAKTGSFRETFFSVGLYKKNQGRLARQLVAGAGALGVILLCWAMRQTLLADLNPTVATGVTVVCAAAGLWTVYRCVNLPQFAEFLIEVQHEMAKVAWPSWPQLQRSTMVVLFTMGLLSFVLFFYDLVWHWLLRAISVLQL